MKVLICGGRDFHNWHDGFKALDRIHTFYPITQIIEGGARGGDACGKSWAKEHGIPIITVPAQWDRYGKSAGYRRNKEMVEMQPDIVVAFPGGRGTQHTIDLATKAGITVIQPLGD